MTRLVDAHAELHPPLHIEDVPDGTVAILVLNCCGLNVRASKITPFGSATWGGHTGNSLPSIVICKMYASYQQYLDAVRLAEEYDVPLYLQW